MTHAVAIRNEPSLTYGLLGFLVRRIQMGDVQSLIAQGMPVALIERLRGLTAQQLTDLAGSKRALFRVEVEAEAFSHGLSGVSHAQSVADLQSYWLEHGATLDMMRDYFRISRESAREARRWLCGEKPFRMSLPDEDECLAIQKMWLEFSAVEDVRERFRDLHRSFDGAYTLRALHFAVLQLGPTHQPPSPLERRAAAAPSTPARAGNAHAATAPIKERS
jgi:Protein of unknown function (DUF2857)